MAVNQHIQALAVELGLSMHKQECLQHLWDNRNEMSLITLSVANMSSSNTTRHFKAGFVYRGSFVRLTNLIAEVTGRQIDDITQGIIVNESAEDQGFVLLEDFYSRLVPKKSNLRAKDFQAVQYYMKL